MHACFGACKSSNEPPTCQLDPKDIFNVNSPTCNHANKENPKDPVSKNTVLHDQLLTGEKITNFDYSTLGEKDSKGNTPLHNVVLGCKRKKDAQLTYDDNLEVRNVCL